MGDSIINSNISIRIGSKYYKYLSDGSILTLRVVGEIDSDNTTDTDIDNITNICVLPVYGNIKPIDNMIEKIDDKNRESSGCEWGISRKMLKSMIEIIPDAKMQLMITQYSDNKSKDVYAWVYREDDIMNNNAYEPKVVLRQDMYSLSKNAFSTDGISYVGDCISYLTKSNNLSLRQYADFEKVIKSIGISMYIDDKLDDIMQCIMPDIKKEFNDTLKNLTQYNSETIKGYCSDLNQLFVENNFMGIFRSIFNITQVDFPIDIINDANLDEKCQKSLEDILRKHINNVIVIKYDKDIDLSEIVHTSHIIICDSREDIYLISYDIVDDYPIDDDILKAFGMKTVDKSAIEEQLGIKL